MSGTIRGFSEITSDNVYVQWSVDLAGQNLNVTCRVDPGWISIGGVQITPGRSLILGCSIMLILGIVLQAGRKSVSSPKVIPFLILLSGMFVPWISLTRTRDFYSYYVITQGQWEICPVLGSVYSTQDNSPLAITPSIHGHFVGFAPLILFLIFILFLGVLVEIIENPKFLSLRHDFYYSIVLGFILMFQWIFLGFVFSYRLIGLYDRFVFGIGTAIPFIAVISWVLLWLRKNIVDGSIFIDPRGWKEVATPNSSEKTIGISRHLYPMGFLRLRIGRFDCF
jgi:hypothetical protein